MMVGSPTLYRNGPRRSSRAAKNPGHGSGSLYATSGLGGLDVPPAAAYRYSTDRKGTHAQALLGSCRGFLHADGYAGFDAPYQPTTPAGDAPLVEVACWMHTQLKSLSSFEVASMIEGVMRYCTELEVDRQYVDSHGQPVGPSRSTGCSASNCCRGSRRSTRSGFTGPKPASPTPTPTCSLVTADRLGVDPPAIRRDD